MLRPKMVLPNWENIEICSESKEMFKWILSNLVLYNHSAAQITLQVLNSSRNTRDAHLALCDCTIIGSPLHLPCI